MKEPKSISDLRQEFQAIKSTVAGDTAFTAKALMFLAASAERRDRAIERLSDSTERIIGSLERRIEDLQAGRKREPTAWNRFFGDCMKRGMTPRQAAELWRSPERIAVTKP